MKNTLNENLTTQITKGNYKTSDLSLITILSLSFPVKTIEKTNSKRLLFCFESTKELNKCIENYWAGDLQVEPQKFFNQLKTIKTRIYSS